MIVAISRSYGAGGHSVAAGLAEALGYRLVDHDLPRVVALRLGTSAASIEAVEEREAGFGARVLRSLGAGSPEVAAPPADVADSGLTRAAIERAVHEAAADGNAVIVGRGSAAILAERPDLIRVFVTGELAWRTARIVAAYGIDARTAREEIARVDGARRTYAQERYRIPWGTIEAYDLMLDVARIGIPGAIAAVAAAVRAAEAVRA